MKTQKEIKNEQTQKSITTRLTNAGIKVQSGKKTPKRDVYSGIISNKKKTLNLKL